MESSNKIQPPVVILGMSANGLSVARSLGRKGIEVIGVDKSKKTPGMKSKYIRKTVIIPQDNDNDILEILKSLGRSFDTKPVLLATADEYVSFISKFRKDLLFYFLFSIPSASVVECFLDKRKTSEFSIANRIPHPKTYFLSSEKQVTKISKDVHYPCLIKPQESHIWRDRFAEQKALEVSSPNELIRTYSIIKDQSFDVMVQEIIPGPDTNIYQYVALCDNTSRVLASFCCHKIRQYPPHFGIACLCESIHKPEIMEAGRKLLSKTKIKGMVAVEFKLHPQNNIPIFLEANIRTSFFGELAVASGIDFPYLLYKDIVFGNLQELKEEFADGVKLLNLDLDLGCYVRLRRNREITLIEWLKAFRAKRIAHTYFAFDDLNPWIFVYTHFFSQLLSKLFSKKKKPFLPVLKRTNTNILHLISSSGFFGAENVLLTLARNLNNDETTSVVGVIKNSSNPHLEILDAAIREGLPAVQFPCWGRFDFRTILKIKKYLAQNNIHLLHSHNYKSNMMGFLAAILAHIPIVATAHGYTNMTSKVTLYERIDRWILKNFFSKVVVVTDKVLTRFPVDKKICIRNGLDISRFTPEGNAGIDFRRQYDLAEDDILVGTIGRISKEKNQKLFLNALYPIIRSNKKVKALIVGTGPWEDDLKKFVTMRHINDKVIFTGIIKDLSPVYQAMDVFVLSSTTEGIPMTILEAMASGVPVVATRVGGVPEIIEDQKTGLLVESGNSHELKEKIEYLIGNKEKCEALTHAALNFVKANYSQEKMCTAYQKFYEEVLV